MAGIDENIVREYFEANGFLVCQANKYQVQSRKKRADENIDFWFFLDSFGAELLFDAGDLLLFIPADLRGPQYEIRIGSVGSIWSNYIGKSTIRRLPNSEIIKRANARLKKLIK